MADVVQYIQSAQKNLADFHGREKSCGRVNTQPIKMIFSGSLNEGWTEPSKKKLGRYHYGDRSYSHVSTGLVFCADKLEKLEKLDGLKYSVTGNFCAVGR